jgi:hypothetical protein
MKIFIPFFFIFLFLLSCKPSDKEIHTDQQGVAILNPNTPVTYAGHWLNKTYYNLIMKDKSPRDAQEKVENSFIRIPAYTNDTTVMIYGFHESGPDIVVVQKPQETELWEVQGDSLDRMAFKVNEIDQNTLLIGTDTFIRINPVQTKYTPLILEEILFKGKYQLKGGGEVEFKNSGEVTGLGKYKYYQVLIDYLDAGLDVDQVGLGVNPDSLDYYGFKMKDNSLELFHLKCLAKDDVDERCQQVAFGKSAYKLTRKE